MLRRRQRGRGAAEADLDVTPFMNLMIVLVPVLLLSMVFTHTTVVELDLPAGEGGAVDPEHLQLEVLVAPDALTVQDARGGVIRSLPHGAAGPDLAGLRAVLRGVKVKVPEKRDVTLLLGDDVPYQVLVSVMDTVRAYPAVVAADVVQAELFPVIALGDLPVDGSAVPAGGAS